MPELLIYLLKVNVALVLFYLAYHVALRRLTFYHLNRLFLVFGIVFSTVYPFIDLAGLFESDEQLAAAYLVTIPAWTINTQTIVETSAFDYWQLPVYLFWAGAVVMLIRFMIQLISLYKIHAASEPANYKNIGFRKVNSISQAFSFWQTIYINPEQHQRDELEKILHHELIHITGWHTLDVLLTELSTVFYWFNPGAWLMKKAVKENLEFIADQNVVNTGVDKKEYQYLLLKVVGATQPQIANQFNFPSLKRRIAMMNKMPTSKAGKLRLLIALPLATALLFAFRNASEPVENMVDKISLSENLDEQQPNEQKANQNLADPYKAFYARNPEVKNLSWRSNNKLVVELKSGLEEVYTFGDTQSMAAAEKKYGELPAVPPIVKRDADNPTSSQGSKNTESAKQGGERVIFPADIDYYQKEENLPASYRNFLKRNPTVEKVGWKLKDNTGPVAILIQLKSGKTETYDLKDKKGVAAAENKYGKLPDLLPPPPPVRAEVPGTPPPPPAPAAEPVPPVPPAPPANEQLPAPPPPVKHDAPLLPATGATLVEDEKTITYVLKPGQTNKREFEVAKNAFKESGFDLNFDPDYSGDKLTGIKITLKSNRKGSNANAVYNTNNLDALKKDNNVIVVKANKLTGELIVGSTIAER